MLIDHIPDGAIRLPIGATGDAVPTKEAVIAELVDLLPYAGDSERRNTILKAVLHREGQMSTGIGDGIAVPHGVAEIDEDITVAVGACPAPGVDFNSIDKKPARIFFLLVARPSARALHMQTLASIARLLQDPDVHRAMLDAADADALRAVLASAE